MPLCFYMEEKLPVIGSIKADSRHVRMQNSYFEVLLAFR